MGAASSYGALFGLPLPLHPYAAPAAEAAHTARGEAGAGLHAAGLHSAGAAASAARLDNCNHEAAAAAMADDGEFSYLDFLLTKT